VTVTLSAGNNILTVSISLQDSTLAHSLQCGKQLFSGLSMKAISQINSEASLFWLILTDYLSKNLAK